MTENNFLDFIKNRAQQLENNQNDDEPRATPKNGYIDFSKNKPSIMLRLVPQLDFLQGNTQDPVGFGYKSIFFNTPHRKADNTIVAANITIGDDQETEQIVNRWVNENKTPSRFGAARPRTNYLVNAIELDPQTLQPVTGHVQVLRVTFSVYKKLVENLSDTMGWAQGAEMGFMDLNYAQPIKITRPQGQGDTYDVMVYTNRTLEPITDVNALMADMEPLSKFAQPTRIETPNWFNTIVGWVDGESTTGVNDDYVTGNATPAFPTQPQPQGNPYVQSSPAQPQPQAQVASQAQGNVLASGAGNWMPQGQGQVPQQQTAPQASAPFQQAPTSSNQPSGLTTANGQSPFGGGQQALPGGNEQSNQAASSGNDDLDAQLNAILGN